MPSPLLTLEGVSVQIGGTPLLDNLDWTITPGEHWALTGPSGSGKTVLAHTLLGRHFHTGQITLTQRAAIVEQQHRFRNRPGSTELYYQQRFNASDADQTITVAQEIADAGWPEPDPAVIDLLHIDPLLQKPLIQLSNGENKRVQLAIALLNTPDFLILDNPFLGLDVEGRATLHDIINKLPQAGIHLLLITNPHELPTAITHVAQLVQGKWGYTGNKAGYHAGDQLQDKPNLDAALLEHLRTTTTGPAGPQDFTFAIRMIDTTICYGETTILKDIYWEVRKGERWNVSGPNGAGKSTLLSLITADNPQAYANEIWLFDRRRGTGETIWDIKKKDRLRIPRASPVLRYGRHYRGCHRIRPFRHDRSVPGAQRRTGNCRGELDTAPIPSTLSKPTPCTIVHRTTTHGPPGQGPHQEPTPAHPR